MCRGEFRGDTLNSSMYMLKAGIVLSVAAGVDVIPVILSDLGGGHVEGP